MINEELWQTVLSHIQLAISPANFATWFRQTSIVSQKDGVVVVSVPNSFSLEWLKNKYHKLIIRILNEQDPAIKDALYLITRNDISNAPLSTTKQSFGISSIRSALGARPGGEKYQKQEKNSVAPFLEQLEFQELKIDKETNLNPRYLFDNFIVGSFNEMAHAAAVAVAKTPGTAYNPLFIYGGVGLGKTHLLQAIGNETDKNFSKQNIKYIPAEKFTSEIVSAIRNHQIESLKTKLQKIDILILDDVQFLAGKEKTQEEFFHLFNTLYEKNKQIILSSDRPPKAINSLAERLRSRFEGGMIADIGTPDFETRLAILKTKAAEKNLEIKEEILNIVAQTVSQNIRELEGALNRLVGAQRASLKPLSTEEIKKLLENFVARPPRISSPKKIVQVVSSFYDLREKEVFEETRKKEVVKPRQIIMFFLREELKYSFPAIGRIFRGKDHTTAIHAFKKIKGEIASSEGFSQEIDLIKKKLYDL